MEMCGSEFTDRLTYYRGSWLPARKLVEEAIEGRFTVCFKLYPHNGVGVCTCLCLCALWVCTSVCMSACISVCACVYGIVHPLL